MVLDISHILCQPGFDAQFFSLILCVILLQVCTAKMNLGDEVDLEDYVSRPDKISAAEVGNICRS